MGLSDLQLLTLVVVAIITVAGSTVFGIGHYLDQRDHRLGITRHG